MMFKAQLDEIDILHDSTGDKFNPRGNVSNTMIMQHHLATEGQKDPIKVVKGADGRLKLIDGECRVVAAGQLGWATLDAEYVVVDLSDDNAIREAMLASDVRTSYTLSQKGRTLAKMLLDQRYSFDRLMVIGGLSSIDETQLVIALASAPASVQKRVDAGELSLTAWRLLRNQPRDVQDSVAKQSKTRVKDIRKGIATAKNPTTEQAPLPVFDQFLKDDGTPLIQRCSSLRNEIYNCFAGLPIPDAVRLIAIAEDIVRLRDQL